MRLKDIFKKKSPTFIEKNYCTKCGGDENLINYSKFTSKAGVTTQYKLCGECNRKRRAEWYAKNKKKQLIYNRRYRARKMGL